jgi:hypothetical protein
MLTSLIWWVVVGLIAGWAAGKIMRGGGYGPPRLSSVSQARLLDQQQCGAGTVARETPPAL